MINPKAVLITGAAGGIGSALARAYAAPGVHLFLGDTSAGGLENLCPSCANSGAIVHNSAVDVTDKATMEAWVAEADAISPLDLVIANAGISHGNLEDEETPEEIRAVFAVNLDGMLNTVLPALPRLRSRRKGQIALMSSWQVSAASLMLPHTVQQRPLFEFSAKDCAARVKREGVSVSVMIPAFVKTPMTDANLYTMPGRIEADRAASIIKRKLAKNKSEFIFPHPYPALAWAFSVAPSSLVNLFTDLK